MEALYMQFTVREVAAWLELVRIARMELILDKLELMITGLDLERSDPMFLYWEQVSEENGEALQRWMALYREGAEVDDWLSDEVTPKNDVKDWLG
jgi:hypothetical protein